MRSSRYVQRAMRIIVLAGVALLVLGLAGCTKKPNGSTGTDPAVTPGGKERGPDVGVLKPSKAPDVKIPPIEIKDAGAEGWKTAPGSLTELGQRMDTVMRVKEPTLCDIKLVFEDPSSGILNMDNEVRIEDERTFDIGFSLPASLGTSDRIRGNGEKRVLRKANAWIALPSFSAKPPRFTKERVMAWPASFPEQMFANYIDGTQVWSELFSAWSKGVGGYKATFEEQSFRIGGEVQSQYRVLATTDEGGPTEVEIIVDKERMRPLTIRVIGTNKDGKEYKMMWSGRWRVGGEFDDLMFVIPDPLPATQKAS